MTNRVLLSVVLVLAVMFSVIVSPVTAYAADEKPVYVESAPKVSTNITNRKLGFVFGTDSKAENGLFAYVTGIRETQTHGILVDYSYGTLNMKMNKDNGAARIWIERKGKVISEVREFTVYTGRADAIVGSLAIIDDKSPLDDLELMLSFEKRNIYSLNMLGSSQDKNAIQRLNGLEFSVNEITNAPTRGVYAYDWASERYLYCEAANIYLQLKIDEKDKAKSAACNGTYVITISSVQAKFSNTISVTHKEILSGNYTYSLRNAENPFIMPGQDVTDLKLAVVYKA